MIQLIRLLIVDDHVIVLRGLATILNERNGMQVVGEAVSGKEAIVKARALRPDVIVMDLNMPGMGGIEAIRLICADEPTARILVLTTFDDDDTIREALQAGAGGYLSKDTSLDELLDAVRKIAGGGTYLSQGITQTLVHGLQGANPIAHTQNTPWMLLTERELDILADLATGMSNLEIAEHLMISRTTVHSHMRSIFGKLGLTNRTTAAVYAWQSGLLRSRSVPCSQ